LIIVERDPLLYERAMEMTEHISKNMGDAAKRQQSRFCSPSTDMFLEELTRNADRVFHFEEGPRASTKLVSKAYQKAQKGQRTLEVWT